MSKMDLQELKTSIEHRKAELPKPNVRLTQTNMRSGMMGRIERQNQAVYNKEIAIQHNVYSKKLSEISKAMEEEKISFVPTSVKDVKLTKPKFQPVRKDMKREGVGWLYK